MNICSFGALLTFVCQCAGSSATFESHQNDPSRDLSLLHRRAKRQFGQPEPSGEEPFISSTSIIRCSYTDADLQPDPNYRCSPKFYKCNNGIGSEQRCDHGTFFDPDHSVCGPFSEVDECTLKRESEVTAPPPVTTEIPQKFSNQRIRHQPLDGIGHTFECAAVGDGIYPTGLCDHTYWMCLGDNAQLMKCPNDLYFNAEIKVCALNWTINSCTESLLGGNSPKQQVFGATTHYPQGLENINSFYTNPPPEEVIPFELPTTTRKPPMFFTPPRRPFVRITPPPNLVPLQLATTPPEIEDFKHFTQYPPLDFAIRSTPSSIQNGGHANKDSHQSSNQAFGFNKDIRPVPSNLRLTTARLPPRFQTPRPPIRITNQNGATSVQIPKQFPPHQSKHQKTVISESATGSPTTTTTGQPKPITVPPEVFDCFSKFDGNYEAAPCMHFFYSCAAGTGYVMKCPANTVYDAEKMICNLIQQTESCSSDEEKERKKVQKESLNKSEKSRAHEKREPNEKSEKVSLVTRPKALNTFNVEKSLSLNVAQRRAGSSKEDSKAKTLNPETQNSKEADNKDASSVKLRDNKAGLDSSRFIEAGDDFRPIKKPQNTHHVNNSGQRQPIVVVHSEQQVAPITQPKSAITLSNSKNSSANHDNSSSSNYNKGSNQRSRPVHKVEQEIGLVRHSPPRKIGFQLNNPIDRKSDYVLRENIYTKRRRNIRVRPLHSGLVSK